MFMKGEMQQMLQLIHQEKKFMMPETKENWRHKSHNRGQGTESGTRVEELALDNLKHFSSHFHRREGGI